MPVMQLVMLLDVFLSNCLCAELHLKFQVTEELLREMMHDLQHPQALYIQTR